MLSGDNYLLSADYPGYAAERLEQAFGCPAMFLNGAQGTMDIDGLRDRDCEGRERLGRRLADAVAAVASHLPVASDPRLRSRGTEEVNVQQVCIAIDDTAFISFPGELFMEIGSEIKRASPFARTYVLGLANGSVGYVPTREATAQGGYEVDTRLLDDSAVDRVLEHSARLLRQVASHLD